MGNPYRRLYLGISRIFEVNDVDTYIGRDNNSENPDISENKPDNSIPIYNYNLNHSRTSLIWTIGALGFPS